MLTVRPGMAANTMPRKLPRTANKKRLPRQGLDEAVRQEIHL